MPCTLLRLKIFLPLGIAGKERAQRLGRLAEVRPFGAMEKNIVEGVY